MKTDRRGRQACIQEEWQQGMAEEGINNIHVGEIVEKQIYKGQKAENETHEECKMFKSMQMLK